MGRHDREHQSDGAWPKDKSLPKDDIRDDWKDDGGRHNVDEQDDGKQDDDDR
ncbi:MAG: hypothetical protein ACRDTT_12170 [Pseudonocardiaceae bacterium]